jgi:L-aminopeptidase/D-esterase-like protein
MTRPRARELGLAFTGTPGFLNAITDVPGVGVGLTTILEDARPGVHRGLCTGVTAILPRLGATELRPVWAGLHCFNGNGELTGSHWIRDGGWFMGPVLLTNTHSVGIAHHAAIRWLIRRHSDAFADRHLWALPVVGETYDGKLNDINAQAITEEHVLAALDGAASGPVAEGNVGGGAGMIAYGFKAGTGTASRRVAAGGDWTLGVLVQANHGVRDWLQIGGVPVGRRLRDDLLLGRETGSIIVVIATDCPLLPHQLDRLARRATLGIGRNGTAGGNGSGDIFLAFSTANSVPMPSEAPPILNLQALNDSSIDALYEAAVQATEEAVVNAMVAAEDRVAVKPAGQVVRAIDTEALRHLMRDTEVIPQ